MLPSRPERKCEAKPGQSCPWEREECTACHVSKVSRPRAPRKQSSLGQMMSCLKWFGLVSSSSIKVSKYQTTYCTKITKVQCSWKRMALDPAPGELDTSIFDFILSRIVCQLEKLIYNIAQLTRWSAIFFTKPLQGSKFLFFRRIIMGEDVT